MTEPVAVPERPVAPEDLFFSTTDRRGVITSVNSVFEKISVYTEEELIGKPHNLLRHPEMPRGLFAIVWERLLAGKPAVAYVQNLAKDAAPYWVLATMTPLGEGFLSVRSAPRDRELCAKVERLYEETLAVEAAAAASGKGRVEVAVEGRRHLESRVRDMGFADVEDFMRKLLPHETHDHRWTEKTADELVTEPGRLREMLEANLATERSLRGLLDRLDEYVLIARALDDARQAAQTLDGAVATASAVSQEISQASPVLGNAGRAAVTMAQGMLAAMQRLTLSLEVTRDLVLDLRLRIALAKVHTDMVSAFVVEVAEGEGGPRAEEQVTWLVQALEQGLADLDATLEATNAGLTGVAEDIDALDADFQDFQRMLATWRQLVVRFRLSDQLTGKLRPVDEQLAQGMQRMAELRELGVEARAVAEPVDTSTIRASFERFSRVRAS